VNYLRQVKLWGNEDPLFPATQVAVNEECRFQVVGLDRKHWSNATPIRKVFREAFQAAGLPYFHPHSLRNTLVQLGQKLCKTPEDYKAWSQNLGHEEVLTTFRSYGAVGTRRQGEIIRELANPKPSERADATEIAKAVMREMAAQSVSQSKKYEQER
jgi:integrase